MWRVVFKEQDNAYQSFAETRTNCDAIVIPRHLAMKIENYEQVRKLAQKEWFKYKDRTRYRADCMPKLQWIEGLKEKKGKKRKK